ncbi:MAG: M15 family metallopeptidase [Eubacteriales bacterium]|nr:M15 family metallopeptidase [Eubacteriales bacterium]
MLNEKRIKLIIIVSLLLIETFVWTANGSGNSWSLGFLGGPDGPGVIGEEDNDKPENEDRPEMVQENTDEGQPDQSEGDRPDQIEQALQEAAGKGLLILVNKEHPVDREYKPDDLTRIKYFVSDRSETTRYMRAEAAAAFHLLVEKAAEEGLELRMTTAYRSYDFQKILFDSYVEREGEAAANTYSARPGQSEHQTGLSADVSSPSVDYQLSNEYGKTEEGEWLAGHAHQFGFIIRFPKGKEEITGYQYEPWHIRYVGLFAAKEIYEQNLTLEEFLQENKLEQE